DECSAVLRLLRIRRNAPYANVSTLGCFQMHSHLFSATRSWPALIALCLSILFGIAGQLLMKWAAMRTVGVTLQWALLPPLALALLVYSVAVVNWIFAVQHLQLSIAYPVSSLNYVGILAGSRYFFGEQISMERAAGVA